MKKNFRLFGAFAVMGAALALNGCGTTPNIGDADDRADLHREVAAKLNDFRQYDYMGNFFNGAYGYAIFPEVVSGAAGVGAAHGTGEVFEHGKFVGYADISQASIGLQLGGQKFSEIIFFQNESSIVEFKNGTTEFDAKVSAVAADEGAARTADYSKGVLVFIRGERGLMAQAAVGGQKFRFSPYGGHGYHGDNGTYHTNTVTQDGATRTETYEKKTTTITNP